MSGAHTHPPLCLRIRKWQTAYELCNYQQKTNGPLAWTRWHCHASSQTVEFRRLARVAGPHLYSALGLFGVMLEFAAAAPRECRDGTLWNDDHVPATLDDVIECKGEGPGRDIMERLVAMLIEARWIERVPYALVEHEGKVSEPVATEERSIHPTSITTNEDPQPASTGWKENAERGAVNDLAVILRVRAQSSQGRTDIVTLWRLVRHVLDPASSRPEVRSLIDDLRGLVAEKAQSTLRNKMAGFLAAAKSRWGCWPALRAKEASIARARDRSGIAKNGLGAPVNG